MRYCRLFYIGVISFLTFQIFAQEVDVQFEEKREEIDMDALRKWIRDKRLITTKEIGGDLSLSGEVRTEFQNYDEKRNGIKQRGPGGATNLAAQSFDVEVDLILDYRRDRTWSAVKLKFDNDMGIASGTVKNIKLDKAYFGGRVVDGDTFTFDIELGRRKLINVFESKLEFGSLFDGVLFKFSKAFESIANFYVSTGAFVIDERVDHFGEVMEFGMLRIADTGLVSKLSFINWKKNSATTPQKLRYNYMVTQFLLAYQYMSSYFNKFFKFYAAGLINTAADRLPVTNNQKANLGWYAGMSVGVVRKKYDWALDANFQWLEAQAVPDFDSIGIGRGNAQRVGLYTTNINGSGAPTTSATAVGSGNYYGFEIDLLYAITDNLTLEQNFKLSNTLDKDIGPNLQYRQYEAEFIYAF
ncbi:MAG: hypothetical protein PVI40_01825 [Chlamydiota bacterium]|jgi:hypothetical protein